MVFHSLIARIQEEFAQMHVMNPLEFHAAAVQKMQDVSSEVWSKSIQSPSGSPASRLFEADRPPSKILLNAMKELQHNNGYVGSSWPIQAIEGGTMAHNMFAASGSAPSAHHNLFGILIKIAFDLSAPQPQTIHHRDVFGRRLSAVLFVPEGFDERFLAHHLHGRLRPIRLFHVKNLNDLWCLQKTTSSSSMNCSGTTIQRFIIISHKVSKGAQLCMNSSPNQRGPSSITFCRTSTMPIQHCLS